METQRTAEVAEPLIGHPRESCTECWSCVRCCPVGAIRLVDGRPEVVRDRCVACGSCVGECAAGGHVVRDDRPAVRALLASSRPVIALLASEFIAALHPATPAQIEHELASLGFWTVETTLLGEEIVAEAYEQLHLREDSLLSIRSTCPVAVDFVRKYYPALVAALAPVVPPYIAQARLIRQVYAPDAAIVYVSPCYARKDEFRDPQFEGAVDAVIDFLELKQLIAEETRGASERARRSAPMAPRPEVLKQVSLTDGFPRQTLASRDLTDPSVRVVRGLGNLDAFLRAVVAGEAGPSIIDMLNCESCIDGPAVSPELSGFARRALDSSARRHPGVTRVSTRAMLGLLPSVATVRSFAPEPAAVRTPVPGEIEAVLAAGRRSLEDSPDCGACGWPTCVEHAVAIIRGESSWDLCLPLQRALLEEQRVALDAHRTALAETQTLDPGTGLWSPRAFRQRLEIELDRHLRYASPMSVVLIGIDGDANSSTPVPPGDREAVAAAVAARFRSVLRTTDFPARWSESEFALILPGIGKTAAFAVAEKVRVAIGETPCTVATGGYTRDVSVTASFGVASASSSACSTRELLGAAEAALHETMSVGKDRVHLAPG